PRVGQRQNVGCVFASKSDDRSLVLGAGWILDDDPLTEDLLISRDSELAREEDAGKSEHVLAGLRHAGCLRRSRPPTLRVVENYSAAFASPASAVVGIRSERCRNARISDA